MPITITVERHGNTAGVSVHNEGAPIPRVDQARIFDAYARAGVPADRIGWASG